jgi:predicted secreted hydrolase
MSKWLWLLILFVIGAVVGVIIWNPQPERLVTNQETSITFEQDLSQFNRVTTPLDLNFPKDMGAHPDYLSEWWYYTGNLFTKEGRHFAYQLTFFRRSIGDNDRSLRASAWATDQVYFAHFAVVDVEASEHQSWEVYSRGAAGLAGAVSDPVFEVWLNDWQVKQIGEKLYQLKAEQDGVILDLSLRDDKGIVLHGDQGLSQKGAAVGNASMYFSQTRLFSEGNLIIQGVPYSVSGYSWMDHEFGTSALGVNQVGWDWFSLQLDNQEEIMIFQIREDSGAISPESGGSWITQERDVKPITHTAFELIPISYWENEDGIEYPVEWELRIPERDVVFTISAVLPDQENRFSYFQYWEGAVRVEGFINEKPVVGFGFLEMTGYAQSMDGLF